VARCHRGRPWQVAEAMTGDLFSKQPATKWFSFTRLTLGCGLTSGFPYFPLVSLLVNNLMPIY
jgi:hypothetical protein